MSPSEAHQIRNILAVILADIEIGNLEAAKQAVYRIDAYLNEPVECHTIKAPNAPPNVVLGGAPAPLVSPEKVGDQDSGNLT